jgi:hypothetical protein
MSRNWRTSSASTSFILSASHACTSAEQRLTCSLIYADGTRNSPTSSGECDAPSVDNTNARREQYPCRHREDTEVISDGSPIRWAHSGRESIGDIVSPDFGDRKLHSSSPRDWGRESELDCAGSHPPPRRPPPGKRPGGSANLKIKLSLKALFVVIACELVPMQFNGGTRLKTCNAKSGTSGVLNRYG